MEMTGEELRKLVRETGKIPEEITHVGGSFDLRGTRVTDLGNLEHVGGDLYLRGTGVTDLGKLEHVGGDLYLEGSSVTELGKLEHVGGDLYLEGSSVTELGKLEHVGGYLDLRGTGVPHIFFKPAGEHGRTGPVFKLNGEALVQLGCFKGTRAQAVDAIREKYGPDSDYEKTVTAAFDEFERM